MKHIFAIPLLIAVVSFIGLIAALLGNGIYDWASWLGLGIPVVVMIVAINRSRKDKSAS
jgi:type IV secretory pathway TrbD component